MRDKKLRYMLLVAASASALVFSGCNKKEAPGTTAAESQTEKETEKETTGETEAIPELKYDIVKDTMWAETTGDGIVKAGSQVFVNYGGNLWRYDTNDGSMTKVVELLSDEFGQKKYWVFAGSVYYIKDNAGVNELWRYNLETDEDKFEAEVSVVPMSIYVDERQVFIRANEGDQIFNLNKDGDTEGVMAVADSIIGLIPEGMQEIYNVNIAYAASHYKYLPLQDGNSLVIADVTGENVKTIPEITWLTPILFEEKQFFYPENDGNGNVKVWKYDVETLEKQCVLETDVQVDLIQAKNGYLYYREDVIEGNTTTEYDYYSVSYGREYEPGSEVLVSSVKSEPGMSEKLYDGIDFFVAEDSIYTEQFKDYGIYFAKFAFGKEEEPEIIEPELVPSYLTGIGHVEATSNHYKADSGNEFASYYIETLVLDENPDSPGIARINEVLKQVADSDVNDAEEEIAAIRREEAEYLGTGFRYSLSLTYKDITFMNDDIICIEMDGYEYTGGAHGMPWKHFFMFNIKTGEELRMTDLIETPLEELQKIVSEKFREKAEKYNFAFESPEDLAYTVAETVSYNSDFYLTDDGMVFYYPPYMIAPFSEGFPEVVVPYDELKLKVKLP